MALLVEGHLQLSLFDQRDLASITAPDFPGARLLACRNPDLAAERARKRQDLLGATERDLLRIRARVMRKRDPLRGKTEIALAVGAVITLIRWRSISICKSPTPRHEFSCKITEINAEATTDGICIVCTNLGF